MGRTSRARYDRRSVKPPSEVTPRQLYCLRQIALQGECGCTTATRTSIRERHLIEPARPDDGQPHPSVPSATWRLTADGEKAVAHWAGKRPDWEPNRVTNGT